MSQPTFPQSDINREDAINQVISSVAMEELGLSHILNAEGEKIQYALGTIPGMESPNATIEEVLDVNESVQETLQQAAINQFLLQSKLKTAVNAHVMQGPPGPPGPEAQIKDFAYIFNEGSETEEYPLILDVYSEIGLTRDMYLVGGIQHVGNALQVEKEGVYRIDWSFCPFPSRTQEIIINLDISPSHYDFVYYRNIDSSTYQTSLNGTALAYLKPNDQIKLQVMGTGTDAFYKLSHANDAYLQAVRISDGL